MPSPLNELDRRLLIFLGLSPESAKIVLDRIEELQSEAGSLRSEIICLKQDLDDAKLKSKQPERAAWRLAADELPPIEEPVWLFCPDLGRPFVGVRTLDGGEWFWATTNGHFYWTDRTAADNQPGWQTDTAEMDDLKPSHWQPLPFPPGFVSPIA